MILCPRGRSLNNTFDHSKGEALMKTDVGGSEVVLNSAMSARCSTVNFDKSIQRDLLYSQKDITFPCTPNGKIRGQRRPE